MTPDWTLGLYLALGLVLGAGYFLSLRWTSARLASGKDIKLTIAAILARFGVLGGALALASLQGALPLLMTALGVFIARAGVLARAKSA